jgi:methionyl-tRNA formyltransferase
MNVVLAAEESAGIQLVRAVATTPHRIVGVLAKPPIPGSPSASVWKVAADLGLPTWIADDVRTATLADRLRAEHVDLLLNVHSLYIIHPQVLAAPKLGCFNLHPGPLPRYAGLNAPSWAIFRGERDHGVTVHRMLPAVDTGPIAYQKMFPIDSEETGLSLSLKCVREGLPLMLKLLDATANDPTGIPQQQQDLALREYFGKEAPDKGRMSWNWPADKILDFVRACNYFPFSSPWGHPRTSLGAQEVALARACKHALPTHEKPGTVAKSSDQGAEVACGDGWILVQKLLVQGKYMSAQQLLKPGDQLG